MNTTGLSYNRERDLALFNLAIIDLERMWLLGLPASPSFCEAKTTLSVLASEGIFVLLAGDIHFSFPFPFLSESERI